MLLRSKSNLDVVTARLSQLGYYSHAVKLRATEFGLPQRRCRYFIIGLRDVFAQEPKNLMDGILGRLSKLHCNPPAVVCPLFTML